MKVTAIFKQVPEGYIGFVKELPGANTQGKTLAEARENLQEATELVLEANRILVEETPTRRLQPLASPNYCTTILNISPEIAVTYSSPASSSANEVMA